MKIRTSELTGNALDWAVLTAEGFIYNGKHWADGQGHYHHYGDSPSTDWTQGGPIIERLGGFELKVWLESSPNTRCEAHIHNYDGNWIEFGPTPLIAAMRCYVGSKLGDEVDVPEELT